MKIEVVMIAPIVIAVVNRSIAGNKELVIYYQTEESI